MDDLIDCIEAAIANCAVQNKAVTTDDRAFLRNKDAMLEAIGDAVRSLRMMHRKETPDGERIVVVCEWVAVQILESANLYFARNPNATSFLEDHFMTDVRAVLQGLPVSANMQQSLDDTYRSWHWHGW